MADLPILIAGGGIAGLAAALGLARKGLPSLVLERAVEMEAVGAGLQIGPNAAKALQWLGAWEALEPSLIAPQAIEIRDARSGKLLQRIDLRKSFAERYGAPYRVAHRADLLSALVETASASPLIAIEMNADVRDIREANNSVGITTAHGKVFEGSHLVGADGIRSLVRRKTFPGAEPQSSGQVLYRALAPLGASTAPIVSLWLGPGFHAVQYPVNGGRRLNIVLAIEETWKSTDWSIAVSPQSLSLPDCCDALRATLQQPESWLKWSGAILKPLPAWHLGRTVLIGDAAHASLPYLAQGAAMALEDAVALARHWPNFPHYEAKRLPRTTRVQQRSSAMASIYHVKGIARMGRNLILAAPSSERFLRQLDWLYGFDPVTE